MKTIKALLTIVIIIASISIVKAQDAKSHYHDLNFHTTTITTKLYDPSFATVQDAKYHLHAFVLQPRRVVFTKSYNPSFVLVQDAKSHYHDLALQSSIVIIKVYGECGSCKKRIENAAKVNGVLSAEWNENTQLLKVHYNNKVINPDMIQQLEAAVGHDTEKYKANTNLYDQLPDCCHYRKNA
jgi:mercuric ion binding protein